MYMHDNEKCYLSKLFSGCKCHTIDIPVQCMSVPGEIIDVPGKVPDLAVLSLLVHVCTLLHFFPAVCHQP